MPKTLVSCRSSRRRGAPCARGFTLLELLVVLSLAALAIGLVGPPIARSIDGARERGVASEVHTVLEGLGVRAFQRGEGIEVDAKALASLLSDLPAGWQVAIPSGTLRYGVTGVSSGGEVRLSAPGRAPLAWRVEPVSGRVLRQQPAGGA